MNKFHRVDKLPCGECKQKFDSFDEMDLHHHLVHGRDGEFACDKCENLELCRQYKIAYGESTW
jgi:hypothetical protein